MIEFIDIDRRLLKAAKDYRLLLDHGYNREFALRFVGDKYRLNELERKILYRSIHPTYKAINTFRKRLHPYEVKDRVLAIDFYNTIITIDSGYLDSVQLYLGNDFFIRDMRGIHGRISAMESKLINHFKTLANFLIRFNPAKVYVFLESQISKSGYLASKIRSITNKSKYEIKVVKHVDKELIKYSVVASSDSIIHEYAINVVDLPFYIFQNINKVIKVYDLSSI